MPTHRHIAHRMTLAAVALLFAAGAAPAQPRRPDKPQVTGTLGSPAATTTITGQQLPPPPFKVGGKIADTAPQSVPWWPPRVVPPTGAPNVLLIMTDDAGYGVAVHFRVVLASIGVCRARLRPGRLRRTRRAEELRRLPNLGRSPPSVQWSDQ
jgi:hypothetical protein